MTAPAAPAAAAAVPAVASKWGNAGDWASIISGLGQGFSSAMRTPSTSFVSGKETAREAKRKTLANALNAALKRDEAMSKMHQQHMDEGRDFQSQAMQQIASGFVNALKGSTGY